MTRIVIEPTEIRGERGQRYRVLYDGEVLIDETWCPECDAARALVANGIAGKVTVWRDGEMASAMDVEGCGEGHHRAECAGRTEGGPLRAVFSGLRSAADGRFGSPRCPGACRRERLLVKAPGPAGTRRPRGDQPNAPMVP